MTEPEPEISLTGVEGMKADLAEKPTPPAFEISSLDDLKRILTIARGGDPDAIQAVSEFMDMKSNIQKTYFPNKKISIAVAQLTGYGQTFFPNDDWDPFTLVANCLAEGFMPFKGFKSNQFVDMTRQTPNLDALQTSSEETKQGLVSKLLGRGSSE